MEWLRIRNTGVSVLDVLELLAEGRGINGILARFPRLTESDISYSATVAMTVIVGHWVFCDSPAMVLHRKHLAPLSLRQSCTWTEDEDRELIRLVDSGATINDLAHILLRLQADITDRLGRLDLNKP